MNDEDLKKLNSKLILASSARRLAETYHKLMELQVSEKIIKDIECAASYGDRFIDIKSGNGYGNIDTAISPDLKALLEAAGYAVQKNLTIDHPKHISEIFHRISW